jgi:hypothetical protein
VGGCQHVGQPGTVVEGLHLPVLKARLVAHATKRLVANRVDANAGAVVDIMHAKSMIGSITHPPIVCEKLTEQGAIAGIDIDVENA